MKKIIITALLLVCSMATVALAQSRATQNSSGATIVASYSGNQSLVWPDRDYNAPLDCWDHPFDIASNPDGTCRVKVYLQAGHTFHQDPSNAVALSETWSDYKVGLGMNFLDNTGQPAVPSQSMSKMPIGQVVNSDDRAVEFPSVKLPMVANRTLLLTLPTIYQGHGNLDKPNTHPWGHIQWFMDGYLGQGPISAYALRFDSASGRYQLAGRAKEKAPTNRD